MFVDSVSVYINLIEKVIDLIEGKKRKRKALETPLGETLNKVETAHEHLTDAIESIDVIREQVVAEKTQLDILLKEVESKREQYHDATNDLNLTQKLLNQDQEKLRSALGVNSSRQKIVGFISGIVASVIATAIWVGGSKLWPYIQTLWGVNA